MDSQRYRPSPTGWPWLAGCAAFVALLIWLVSSPGKPLQERRPGADQSPTASLAPRTNPALIGKVARGTGVAADLPGEWPQFRGLNRDGLAVASHLAASWSGGSPRELWSATVGEGYAGPAVSRGRVYLMDYDREGKQDALRCLSLADGQEIWRYSYPVSIKRNHGMSRTVPAVQDPYVVAMGPKCHVICCDAATGQLRWSRDLVAEMGATVPEWYAGQCPLVDGEHVILAPGGPDALLLAVRIQDGQVVWQTPNPRGWKMTHASVMPVEVHGQRQYVYCANKGVVAVSASSGQLLWETAEWKISIATVPSPCRVDESRIFLTGGYNAGSMMLRLEEVEGAIAAQPLFRLDAETFGATQQTPICFENHLYGVRADGRLVCLTLEGRVVWESSASDTFGLGPLLLADGRLYAMNDSGLLRLIKATPARYEKLAEAQVLDGHESWGPMALAGTRLLVRDFTRLACLDVGAR